LSTFPALKGERSTFVSSFVYLKGERWTFVSSFVYLKGERWTFEYNIRIKRQQVIFSQPKVDKNVILEKG
jgi:hypothetical protein